MANQFWWFDRPGYSNPWQWLHSPALLDLFLSPDTSNCSTVTFCPLGNSDHFVASFSTEFSSNLKKDVPYHHMAFDYSHASWDGLCNHLRDLL